MDAEFLDAGQRREQAAALRAEATSAMSLSRDQTVEIMSARQLEIWENTARRILALAAGDAELTAEAEEMLTRVRDARRWVWINQSQAVLLGFLAVIIGVGAAVFGGLAGNIGIAVVGALAGSALLAVVIIRHRLESWRIRARRIAPMIWKAGV